MSWFTALVLDHAEGYYVDCPLAVIEATTRAEEA